MQWIMLLIAGSLEITWAVAMKYSEGFSKLGPSALTAVTYILSAVFLALALKKLPLGTAYPPGGLHPADRGRDRRPEDPRVNGFCFT